MEIARLRQEVGPRDHALGPELAPVTLVEYGDYECPHCARAARTVAHLREEFGADLRFVFRNFPLRQIHPHAEAAAEAAEAADAQGSFWEMHALLFENQNALERNHLIDYASRLGLHAERFVSDLNEAKFSFRIREGIRSGLRSGVNGTPTFFIDGERYDGPNELEPLISAIRAALARSEMSRRKAG